MGKKYLLTFSLAAISCLANKKIQEVFKVDAEEHKRKIVNYPIPEIQNTVQIAKEEEEVNINIDII